MFDLDFSTIGILIYICMGVDFWLSSLNKLRLLVTIFLIGLSNGWEKFDLIAVDGVEISVVRASVDGLPSMDWYSESVNSSFKGYWGKGLILLLFC